MGNNGQCSLAERHLIRSLFASMFIANRGVGSTGANNGQ